jgi:superfamily II DNA or RNA helicase/HKD family nuclease
MRRAVTSKLVESLSSYNDTNGVDFIVSFVRYSGLKLIEEMIVHCVENGIPVRVLTSTYLDITQPVALYKLLYMLPEGTVHLYNGKSPSFHPKAYFFKSDEGGRVYLGSSNISKSALVDGVEWNYCIEEKNDLESYKHLCDEFEKLYNHESVVLTEEIVDDYASGYVFNERYDRKINKHFNSLRKARIDEELEFVEGEFVPNTAQKEALLKLEKTRKDGNDKALCVVATGVGKTALAAFDSLSFSSVLFVAHREEILEQAIRTFHAIRKSDDIGRFYDGIYDCKDVLFASVQTLSRTEHIEKIDPLKYEYVIIDEFHHAATFSYKKIVDYFKPKFLLGLTATPHRMDRKNVFEICDYNIAYDLDFFSAINRDLLSPFQYYGIYDFTVDYDTIRYQNGKYVSEDLEKALMIGKRADLIFTHYKSHYRKRTLAFCSGVDHAEMMAEYFQNHGVIAYTVHSQAGRKHLLDREIAVENLKKGSIEILFTVDMFNEGLDVPAVDMILMARPTESITVFLQQLGRGLRKSEGKMDLKILDFVGNYKKVEMIPQVFLNKYSVGSTGRITDIVAKEDNLPLNCQISFDPKVIDIIEKSRIATRKQSDTIVDYYWRCKRDLRYVPTRVELYNSLTSDEYAFIKSFGSKNPFKNYYEFLKKSDSDFELELDLETKKFIEMIESTSFSRLYKVPILLAFFNEGHFRYIISKEDIIQSFRNFYANQRNFIDIQNVESRKRFHDYSDNEVWKMAKDNPVHFLSLSHSDIFEALDTGMRIIIDLGEDIKRSEAIYFIQDAIQFRRNEFIDLRLDKKSYCEIK